MKLTRKIKKRTVPSVIGGFTLISHLYMPIGYYRNRGIRAPWEGQIAIGRIESVRFIVTPNVNITGTP